MILKHTIFTITNLSISHKKDDEMTTLNQLPFGVKATIHSFLDEAKPFRRKLLAMGVTPGSEVSVVRVAPMGDPIQISIRGFQLCLRKSEAKAIHIKQVD